MCSLQLGQKFHRPRDQPRWEARQACDLDPVGPVRSPLFQSPQEDDIVARLSYRDVQVPHGRELIAQLGELVVVRCADPLRADAFVQVLGDRPRDGHPVVGGGAAPDLVEEHEAPLGGPMDDRRGLAHLDHEGGLAARQVVRGAHAGEDAVADTEPRAGRRHERPDLGHELDQADLAQHCTLPGHVGPGQDHDASLFVQLEVVGNELLARHHRLDDRVPPRHDTKSEPRGNLGTDVATLLGHLGQRGQHVQIRHAPAGLLDARNGEGELAPHPQEKSLLEARDTVVRVEDLLLPLLQLQGEVAFRVGQRLLAYEALGDARQVRSGDLQVVAEDLVVPDLERGDAGLLALCGLQPGDEVASPVAGAPELVHLLAEALPDHAAVCQRGGRVLGDGLRNERLDIVQRVHVGQQSGQDLAAQSLPAASQRGKLPERLAQRQHLPGRGAPGADLGAQPVQIADLAERPAQVGTSVRILEQLRDSGVPAPDLVGAQQRIEEPGP